MKTTNHSIVFNTTFFYPLVFLLILGLLFSSFLNPIYSQYKHMDDLNEVGAGNFYIHLDEEVDVKRIVIEKIKSNNFVYDELEFYKKQNLYFFSYYVNPLNTEFVYIIHALKARQGYDVYFIYMENRYRFFYDIIEGNQRISLIYDPAILKNKNLAPLKGGVIKD